MNTPDIVQLNFENFDSKSFYFSPFKWKDSLVLLSPMRFIDKTCLLLLRNGLILGKPALRPVVLLSMENNFECNVILSTH